MNLEKQVCECGERKMWQCPGRWEKGCDYEANEKHVQVAELSPLVDALARRPLNLADLPAWPEGVPEVSGAVPAPIHLRTS